MSTNTQSDLAKRQAKKDAELKARQAAKDAKKGQSGPGKQERLPTTETAKGELAVNNGIGQDALAAGENIANRYIPAAQQLNTAPTAGQLGAAGQLNSNIAANPYVTGALNTQQQMTQRSGAQQDVLNRQNDVATNGLNSQEYQGLREQMQNGLNSSLNTNMSQLAKAQARGKVYGAAASAQQANALNAADAARANNEQQLMLKGGDIRRQGLTDYSNTLNTQDQALAANANNYSQAAQNSQNSETSRAAAAAGQENVNAASQLDKEKFNIGEQDANTAARIGAITNTAGLVNAQKTTNVQQALFADSINALGGGNLDNYNKAIQDNRKKADRANRADAELEQPQNPALAAPAKPKTPAQQRAGAAKKAAARKPKR